MPLTLPGQTKKDQPEPRPFTVEDFGSLDTKATRPAIDSKSFAWIQNWIPIGAGNMRTLYAESATPLYTAAVGRTIIHHAFYNIGTTEYAVVFLDNGTGYQVRVSDGATTTISATANIFWQSGQELPAVAQWQSKYLIIVADNDTNGYWIWNGTKLFTNGTLAPTVTMETSGSTYASVPTVTAYGGTGTGATFTAVVENNRVADVTVTDGGSGYLIDEQVTLIFTGGGSEDQARATATLSLTSGGVAIVLVTNGGSNYSKPIVTFAGGAGSGALAFVSGASNGVVTEVTITNPGVGYTSPPTVTIADSGGGAGAGATAVCELRMGQITAITINNGGTGYDVPPDVIISDPDGAEFPNVGAEATCTTLAGVVNAITIRNNGLGYKTAKVEFQGGNNAARASIKLMPFGISGSSVETYQSRVWVAEDTKFSFTAADSLDDFSTALGGGSRPVTDNNLKKRVVALRASNGFLYRFGDSSISVISNVQTSTSAVTTFNDTNVDPQIGSAWRDTIVSFGRALVFANSSGVYALYGGAAEKVSPQLDGLFAKASFNTAQSGITPTACVVNIFGIRCYALSFTTTDPYTNTLRDVMCLWDGTRWFAATQLVQPDILSSQIIDSKMTAWGSKGRNLYKLFQVPSGSLLKVFQTKLFAFPSYMHDAQAMRVYYIAKSNQGSAKLVTVALENEAGANPAISQPVANTLTFMGSELISWTGAAAAALSFSAPGLFVIGYTDSQYGRLLGATLTTDHEDLTMVSLTMLVREFSVEG